MDAISTVLNNMLIEENWVATADCIIETNQTETGTEEKYAS